MMDDTAKDKVNARITTLNLKLRDLEVNYRRGLFAGVTKDEFKLVIDGTKKELKIWEHIKTKLI